jgi:S1-C subfamily serine protease
MRRTIRTLAILALLGCGIAATWEFEHTPKPRVKIPTTRYHGYELNRVAINRAKSFTVLISREGFEGWGRGTGVLLDAMHVLTCAHMVEGPEDDLWIFPYPAGVVAKGKPVFVNRGMDLAILELDKAVVIPYYAVFMDMHYDGEPITIIGNTLGSMKWFVSFGIVSGDFESFLLTDGVLYGGNSGGPWINEQGEIVALTDWTLQNGKGESLGIHGGIAAKTIHEFLRSWKSPSIGQILQMLLGGDGIKKGDK